MQLGISQSTRFGCDEIIYDHFVTDFLRSVYTSIYNIVKQYICKFSFENRSIFGAVMIKRVRLLVIAPPCIHGQSRVSQNKRSYLSYCRTRLETPPVSAVKQTSKDLRKRR